MAEDAVVATHDAVARLGIGCGATAAMIAGAVVLTVATIVVAPWVNPALTSHGGFGQGLGFLLIPFVALAPVVGLLAAWKPRAGAVLGIVVLLALSALFVAVLAGF